MRLRHSPPDPIEALASIQSPHLFVGESDSVILAGLLVSFVHSFESFVMNQLSPGRGSQGGDKAHG